MEFRHCTLETNGEAILEILNEAIANSTAIYDYRPRSDENMKAWFAAKKAGGYPVIGAFDAADELVGFGSYGTFRGWPAYKYSVEHSVYVRHDRRGGGLGTALMRQLIAAATRQQFHLLIGAIDAANAQSIALHEKLGFSHAGTIRQAGFKFGRWLDVAFYQLILDAPARPVDG
jgi:phosphinothricin acetyltransferase